MEKWPQMAPNRARRIFPTNPDLANILGRMDLDFGGAGGVWKSRNLRTWKAGNLEIWGPGNPEICRSGDLEIQKCGEQRKQNIEILKIQIRSAQNVGKVWISRKKRLLDPFHAISDHFSMDRKHLKNVKICLFSLVVGVGVGVRCWLLI